MNRHIRHLLSALILPGLLAGLSLTPVSAAQAAMSADKPVVKAHRFLWRAPEDKGSAQEVMDYLKLRLTVYQRELNLKPFGYEFHPREKNGFELKVMTTLPPATIDQALLQNWPVLIKDAQGRSFGKSARVLASAQVLPQECHPRDTEKRYIELKTTSDGAIKLAEITSQLRDEKLAVFLGETKIIEPVIRDTIKGGVAKIELSSAAQAASALAEMQKNPQHLGFYKQHPGTGQWIPVNLSGADLTSITTAGAEPEGPPHCDSYTLKFGLEPKLQDWLQHHPKQSPLSLTRNDQPLGELKVMDGALVLQAKYSEADAQSLQMQSLSQGLWRPMKFLSYASSTSFN